MNPEFNGFWTDCVLTSRFAIGVLSSPGRCCSKARTTQLAVMVARIMYSKGVKAAKLRKILKHKDIKLETNHGEDDFFTLLNPQRILKSTVVQYMLEVRCLFYTIQRTLTRHQNNPITRAKRNICDTMHILTIILQTCIMGITSLDHR